MGIQVSDILLGSPREDKTRIGMGFLFDVCIMMTLVLIIQTEATHTSVLPFLFSTSFLFFFGINSSSSNHEFSVSQTIIRFL